MPTPQEVIDSAKPGDTVKITLRGPASASELLETKALYEVAHPGIEFIIADDGLISSAELVEEASG